MHQLFYLLHVFNYNQSICDFQRGHLLWVTGYLDLRTSGTTRKHVLVVNEALITTRLVDQTDLI